MLISYRKHAKSEKKTAKEQRKTDGMNTHQDISSKNEDRKDPNELPIWNKFLVFCNKLTIEAKTTNKEDMSFATTVKIFSCQMKETEKLSSHLENGNN